MTRRWTGRGYDFDLDARPVLMGILNVTPDSFSDGGLDRNVRDAVDRGLAMVRDGADIVDVGGESTRPGSAPVDVETECARVVPVIAGLRAAGDFVISVDTSKAVVAGAALAAGANVVNDVSALRDPAMADLVARTRAGLVLMHMRGAPADMQSNTAYSDLIGEIRDHLAQAVAKARKAGVGEEAIVVDPGIGFGKSAEQNMELLRRADAFAALGRPMLVGVSRKRFLGHLTGADAPDRDPETIAATLFALERGVRIHRVHAVGPAARAIRVWTALRSGGDGEPA